MNTGFNINLSLKWQNSCLQFNPALWNKINSYTDKD
jgi:hypothetical protein